MKTFDEQWKPVEGFENYEISNLGRVKSLGNNKSRKEKFLKPGNDSYGYLQVDISRNGKQKTFKVHKLVATAFLPNPEGLPEVNHKDENKSNNCVSNLEWCTPKYNSNYGTRNKRIAAAFSKAVEASRFPDFRTIEFRFVSIAEAGRNGYHCGDVSDCCNGRYCSRGNFYKGLFWRYAV